MKVPFKVLNVAISSEAFSALKNYKIINKLTTQSEALNQILLQTSKQQGLPAKTIPKYKRKAYKQEQAPKPSPKPIRQEMPREQQDNKQIPIEQTKTLIIAKEQAKPKPEEQNNNIEIDF